MRNDSLFVKLCNWEHLQDAWYMVKQKKSAGGIDEVSVADFAKNEKQHLADLLAELETEQYVPHPYKEVKIPKDDKEFRVLGLPTVRDKVVQQAVKLLIEPLVEPQFLDISYGYRPNKSAVKAAQRVRHFIMAEKKYWLVVGDIDNFFDNIPHKPLLETLRSYVLSDKIMDLLQLWIKMPRLNAQYTWLEPKKGIPQGNVLSPLMSNIYLHALDRFLVQRKYGFVRYADDFVLLTDTQKNAQKAGDELVRFVNENLGLSLNAPPTVQRVETGFPFLGVWFNGSDITITEEKKADIAAKLQAVETNKEGFFSENYTATIESLQHYYGKLLPPSRLEAFDMIWATAVVQHYRKRLEEDSLDRAEIRAEWWKELHFFTEQAEKAHQKGFTLWVKAIKSRKALPETVLASAKEEAKEKQAILQRVEQRKKAYLAKAKQHKEVIITTSGIFLGKSKGMLVVKKEKKVMTEIPFKKIEHITLLSRNFTLSSDFLYQCSVEKINIHYLDYTGKNIMLMLPPAAISFSAVQAQIAAYNNGKGLILVTKWLTGKLKNQRSLLKYFGKYLKKMQSSEVAATEKREEYVPFEKEIATIDKCLLELEKVADSDWATMRGQWFAIEGRAAQAYWAGVEILLQPYVDFPGRKRHGATDFVNMCLNYAYGILYSRIRTLLNRKGLQENLSYLHTPSEQAEPTLSYDVIELFRTHVVDRTVFAWLRKEVLPNPLPQEQLTENIIKTLTNKVLDRLEALEMYRKDVFSLEDIIENQVQEVKAFLLAEKGKYLPYLAKW